MASKKRLKRENRALRRQIAEIEQRLADAAAIVRTTAIAVDQMREPV